MMKIGILNTNGRWAVNGTPIYIPSPGMTMAHESIQSSDTGRTEDGVMKRVIKKPMQIYFDSS